MILLAWKEGSKIPAPATNKLAGVLVSYLQIFILGLEVMTLENYAAPQS